MGNNRSPKESIDIRKFIDTQLSAWPFAAENFRRLKETETRSLATSPRPFSLQHNPARAVSTGADTTASAIASRPCFLCAGNRPAEQISLPFGGDYEILVNPYPIFPDHLTIAATKHTPQHFDCATMIRLAKALDGFTIFYNGPRCGASAPDHSHFQAAPSRCFPVWNDLPDKQYADVAIFDILPGCISVLSDDSSIHEAALDRILSGLPSAGADEPDVNILTCRHGGKFRSVIFPRRRHRPLCFGTEDDPGARMISPASIDMAGVIVTPRRSDFMALSADEVCQIINETGFSAEELRGFLTPRLNVGIVEADTLMIRFSSPFTADDGSIYSGTRTFTPGDAPLRLKPSEPNATFTIMNVTIGIDFHWQRHENQTFRGELHLIADNGHLHAVNRIDVESYLESVISSEMNAGAPTEFLKAHAVISRSWVLAQINPPEDLADTPCTVSDAETVCWTDHAAHSLFNVCADDHCQRYQGCTKVTTEAARMAVEATRGMVLTSDGELCDTRFSKCCGGITEIFSTCWQPVDKPYLRSFTDSPDNIRADVSREPDAENWITSHPDAFCADPPESVLATVLNDYDRSTPHLYRWTVEYTADELAAIVAERTGSDFGRIRSLTPLHRGPSGRIDRLRLSGTKKERIIGKELEIRRSLSRSHLYSSAFIAEGLDPDPDGIPSRWRLRGAGWGHGVGLCQIGAAVMASRGYSFRSILSHYFPGSQLTSFGYV